ncbi:MAG TPA: hypothetical protein PKM91_13585 [Cyclobacteriaceae bacterium]|nr:hypothetical protein [Cyclobacteriaceae bacterium]
MQYLTVQKGQRISVSVSFSCAHENFVSVCDFASGAQLFNANSHMNNNRSWQSPVNTGNVPVAYKIFSQHKNTPPNGNEPWHDSAEQIIFANAVSKIIGYEDSNDADYNDATATVLWS